MAKAPPWDPSSPEFNSKEHSMFVYRGRFVNSDTPASKELFIYSITLYAYDAADVMDDNNDATMLESLSIYHHCE